MDVQTFCMSRPGIEPTTPAYLRSNHFASQAVPSPRRERFGGFIPHQKQLQPLPKLKYETLYNNRILCKLECQAPPPARM